MKSNHKIRILQLIIIFFVISICLIGQIALAAYPEKPITWIVTWPAGGRTDSMVRIFAPTLEKIVGVPVVVINKPGASGVIGAKEVAQSKPDGYTLMMISNTMLITQYTMPTPTNLRDYVSVCYVVSSPNLLTVNSKAPWKSVKEFAEYAKANPNKLKICSAGTGTNDHIFFGAFQKAAGIKLIHVPYAGDAPAIADLVGGHVDASVAVMPAVKSFIAGGELKVLGVASDTRRSQYSNIPTFKEQGVNLSFYSFEGIYVPKGTPANIVQILERAFERVVKDPDVIRLSEKLGAELEFKNHNDFVKYVAEEDRKIRELVDELGLRVAPKK